MDLDWLSLIFSLAVRRHHLSPGWQQINSQLKGSPICRTCLHFVYNRGVAPKDWSLTAEMGCVVKGSRTTWRSLKLEGRKWGTGRETLKPRDESPKRLKSSCEAVWSFLFLLSLVRFYSVDLGMFDALPVWRTGNPSSCETVLNSVTRFIKAGQDA